jgi:hypothetical protein
MIAGMDADHRLATYGSLAPGRPNHHPVAALRGRWIAGAVHGRLLEAGWGASLGYRAMVLDPAGPAIDVRVLESGRPARALVPPGRLRGTRCALSRLRQITGLAPGGEGRRGVNRG